MGDLRENTEELVRRSYLECLLYDTASAQDREMIIPGFIDLHIHAPQVRTHLAKPILNPFR